MNEAESTPQTTPAPTPKLPWFKRRRNLILIAVGTVVVISGGALAWTFTRPGPATVAVKTAPSPSPTPVPTPATKLSPLTGLPVAPALADRPIRAVVIENHPDARPQSGLSQAGVVYEANAEGGITRFIAFFLDQQPPSLGPVRSLRTYFVDWALEFGAPVAHAGGNADALDLVGPLGMKDMNALSFAADAFFRTNDRAAPHNLYTDSGKLDALVSRLGFGQPANFTVSPRKPDAPNPTPPHPNIHIDYSYAGYQVDYKYDSTTNDYARNLSGAPHIDRNTGKQIHVKNVVVEMMPTSYGTTRIGESTVIMQTVGTGQGWVMRDGDVIPCTWSKDSHSARTKLLDASGKDIPLDAGNTWYSIVPVGKNVSF
jgi:hypothetical protein